MKFQKVRFKLMHRRRTSRNGKHPAFEKIAGIRGIPELVLLTITAIIISIVSSNVLATRKKGWGKN